MGVKNTLNSCIRYGANTGFGNCFTRIGFVKGLIFGNDPNATYTTASVAALKTALEAAILADLPLNRVYPVGGFVTPTDSSEAPVDQTFADGSKARVREGKYGWTFQWVEGAFCLLYALRQANGLNRPFFIYTQEGLLIGTDAFDSTNPDLMKMIKPDFAWTDPFKLNTGAALEVYATQINFEPTSINDNIAFVDFSKDGGLTYLKGLKGLQDVNITKVARAANVLTVSAKTNCGTTDLGTLYGATLGAVNAWVATNAAGAILTLTSVTYSANLNAYVLTVDATDPDYTAGAPTTINLTGPTELAAAPFGVKGYSGIPAVIVV